MKVVKLTLRIGIPSDEDIAEFVGQLTERIQELCEEEEIDLCPAVAHIDAVKPENVVESPWGDHSTRLTGLAALSPDYEEWVDNWEAWAKVCKEYLRDEEVKDASTERQS